MAKPVWQQKLQEKLDNCPLYFVDGECSPTCKNCVPPTATKLKKLTLRQVVNYTPYWNKCSKCGKEYR